MTEERAEQPKKRRSLILVILLGIVTEVRPVQSLNAYSPMLFTEFGMLIVCRFEQPANASFGMDCNVFGNEICFILEAQNVSLSIGGLEK